MDDERRRQEYLKERRRKKKEKQEKKRRKRTVILVLGITLVICGILLSNAIRISKSNSDKEQTYESLQLEATKESKKGDELEESKKYVKSNDYIESIARERLNLAKEDEIIVQPKDN